jgi:hypothetical protein
MPDIRQWTFLKDMNYSGSLTISDVWLWTKWLYFYPGDGAVYLIINNIPSASHFFEITYDSYGGVFSGIFSLIAWIILLMIYVVTFGKYHDDHWRYNR